MRFLFCLFFFIGIHLSNAQEMVFRMSKDSRGNPMSVRFMARNIYHGAEKEYQLFGNIWLDYFSSSYDLKNSTFLVYTTNQVDERIAVTSKSQTESLQALSNKVDSSLNALETNFTKTVIENVDMIKSQVRTEMKEELRSMIQELLKTEMDNLRRDLQTQIDDIKQKLPKQSR